jgi:hypothetical protein
MTTVCTSSAAGFIAVNPAGRFGAPETEPGPSGVDRGAEDALRRISCHKASRRLVL